MGPNTDIDACVRDSTPHSNPPDITGVTFVYAYTYFAFSNIADYVPKYFEFIAQKGLMFLAADVLTLNYVHYYVIP